MTNKTNTALIIGGICIILTAPLLGTGLAGIYLRLLGGMETEKYMLIIEGCIRSLQLTGGLMTAAYAALSKEQVA